MNRKSSHPSPRLAVAFYGIVLLCVLILMSMPVLPTTDGPIHRYYVGVLHDVLSHNGSVYDQTYAIRHPFPPYAMQYFVELGLAPMVGLRMAEKIFAAMTLLITAYGFRSAARGLGKNGDAIALGVSCLLLPWSLWMGFFNYTMAVGLSLIALSLWLHARAGRKKLWPLFAILCLLIVVTHPVPLLVLVSVLLLDLGMTLFKDRGSKLPWDAVGAFAFVAIVSLYPLFIGAGTHGGTLFQDYGFHLKRIVRQLLLFGLSPYAVRSRAVLPNLYRVTLYAVLAIAVYFGWTAWKQSLRTSSLEFTNLLLPAGVLLGFAILVMPDGVSGSFFFATRMMPLVWIALLLSASNVDFPSERMRRAWLAATGSMFAVIVLAAVTLIFPVSTQIAALETETLPAAGAGLVLDPSQDHETKVRGPLEFVPYHWAGAIPFTSSHQLLLDSPWLEQAILPLTFRSGSPLLNAQISQQEASKVALHDGTVRWLQPESLQGVLRNTSVIFYRTPFPEDRLSDQIGNANASRFSCKPRSWYLRCLRNSTQK